jgi:hypothetical protein
VLVRDQGSEGSHNPLGFGLPCLTHPQLSFCPLSNPNRRKRKRGKMAAAARASALMMSRPVTFVTGNAKKLEEVRAILGNSIPFQSLKLDCKLHSIWHLLSVSLSVSPSVSQIVYLFIFLFRSARIARRA